MEQRPGIAYRRPGGEPSRLEIDAGDEPRLDVEALPRTRWLEVVAPEDRDRVQEALDGDMVDVTYRLTIDGEPTWVHERGSYTDDGDVVGYLFPAGDRVEHRQRLEKQRERLEEFASVVSHDLRNPLSVAVGNIELAKEFEGEEADERLDRAHDALDWMDELISDLLALAREGRSVEETSTVDLRSVVDQAWRTVGSETDAALVIDEPLPYVTCDRSRLRQALENLFRNAIEHGTPDYHSADWVTGASDSADPQDDVAPGTFTDTDGEREATRDETSAEASVRIFVGRLPDGFYVADDGPGIDPSNRESVFDPGHTTADEGTGFGLTIVERIADAHGWDVSVTEGRTGGARFEFEGVGLVNPDDTVGVADPFSDDQVATDSRGSGGSSTE